MHGTVEQRFWAKVNKSDDCWLWTACRTNQGYGQIKVGERLISVHRFSYELHHGAIPVGMFVCHTCDIRNCVNPAHLWLGTTADNTHDMIAKGRRIITKGDAFVLTKVTDEQVSEIRSLWATGRYLQREIAVMFGVNRTHVCNIVNNKARR